MLLWQTVPDTSDGDKESSFAVVKQLRACDVQPVLTTTWNKEDVASQSWREREKERLRLLWHKISYEQLHY